MNSYRVIPPLVKVLSLAHFQNSSKDSEKPKKQVALGLKEIASEVSIFCWNSLTCSKTYNNQTETLKRRVNLRVMCATHERFIKVTNLVSGMFKTMLPHSSS